MTFALPKISLPKFAPPKIGLSRRAVLAAASALVAIGAGFSAWLYIKPRLDAHKTAAPAAAQAAGGKAAAKGKRPASDAKKTAAATPVLASPSEAERMVLRLQYVQERVAAGDPAAYVEMPKLLRQMAERFEKLPPRSWAERRNARAFVLYLLSGGSSAVGRRILHDRTLPAAYARLARASVAYLDNVKGPARNELLSVDPRALDEDLGAQVAFVQAILLSDVDRQKAIEKLDLARLLAPGGLVEEASLRREVGLLSATTQTGKFAELARQYWERYRASPYADNFLRQFTAAVARVSVTMKLPQWSQLDELTDGLKPETRRALYLVMARTAAVAGNEALAQMASQRALELSAVNSLARQRALLYRAAASIASADLAQDRKLLGEVDRAKLPPGDQPLYDAVAMAVARIYRAPVSHFSVAPPPGARDSADAAMKRAQTSLNGADAVLASVRRSMTRKSL